MAHILKTIPGHVLFNYGAILEEGAEGVRPKDMWPRRNCLPNDYISCYASLWAKLKPVDFEPRRPGPLSMIAIPTDYISRLRVYSFMINHHIRWHQLLCLTAVVNP
jgi:hypothetical protein